MDAITDAEALRVHYGPVSTLAANKVLTRLDAHCRAFIGLSPFLVLATADGQGGADASPRGDAPGFVAVLDDTTLLLPDRPGNKRVDSYRNILAHPGVGLIFFVPGVDETVRVNGTARVVTGAELLAQVPAQGKIPATGLLITVQEAFFHCGKALIRSKLWDPASRIERKSFPTLGRIIADQTRLMSSEDAETRIADGYRNNLY
ncbi:pyridoxamine 5'-phosphate oxidase family protein [Limobrevibacterium gyesilva]|uniref:Pyridoxamine 5'-phosphate oxidase family protein n=1 Tax=Limobrevibacterium gyesilva TaxID=2991712 RepID=A0AA41YJ98_9PROT|nr:pyridoxamine 5'-phosphate oxidase family protein [Limobrevibacterium gyesilva]MCW3474719.1 pyridoxamine 5'-phosphate oxidase family protein [Limobrevibacterium gyesilva]